MPTLEDLVEEAAARGVARHLEPYTRRLIDPEPLTYTIPQAALVIGTSPTTVRKLVDGGHLPLVPHMGERRLIPRAAIEAFVHAGMTEANVAPSSIRSLEAAG